MPIDRIGDFTLSLALVLPRIAASFLILPLMTSETVPGLVRNAFFVSLALIAFPIAAAAAPAHAVGQAGWMFVVIKEIFLGLVIGFSFGAVFWAVGAAGGIVDTQIGSNFANTLDPIQGHQTSLTGALFSQLATWMFMASGAFLVFLELLLNSYVIWPIDSFVPTLKAAGVPYFIGQLRYIMSAALLFASPALVTMLLVDLSFGLINRYAQQLNVFSLTMPIKAWVSQWLSLLSLGLIMELAMRRMLENKGLLEVLRRLF